MKREPATVPSLLLPNVSPPPQALYQRGRVEGTGKEMGTDRSGSREEFNCIRERYTRGSVGGRDRGKGGRVDR